MQHLIGRAESARVKTHVHSGKQLLRTTHEGNGLLGEQQRLAARKGHMGEHRALFGTHLELAAHVARCWPAIAKIGLIGIEAEKAAMGALQCEHERLCPYPEPAGVACRRAPCREGALTVVADMDGWGIRKIAGPYPDISRNLLGKGDAKALRSRAERVLDGYIAGGVIAQRTIPHKMKALL